MGLWVCCCRQGTSCCGKPGKSCSTDRVGWSVAAETTLCWPSVRTTKEKNKIQFTLCNWIQFSIHIDKKNYRTAYSVLKGVTGRIFLIELKFCLWRLFYSKQNSVDPDEMQYNAAFHQGLHCLSSIMLHFICVFTVCHGIMLHFIWIFTAYHRIMLHFIWVFIVCQA